MIVRAPSHWGYSRLGPGPSPPLGLGTGVASEGGGLIGCDVKTAMCTTLITNLSFFIIGTSFISELLAPLRGKLVLREIGGLCCVVYISYRGENYRKRGIGNVYM